MELGNFPFQELEKGKGNSFFGKAICYMPAIIKGFYSDKALMHVWDLSGISSRSKLPLSGKPDGRLFFLTIG
jgi:hypothetical protein